MTPANFSLISVFYFICHLIPVFYLLSYFIFGLFLLGVTEFAACVAKCCEKPNCDAVFFSQKRCFTIDCVSNEACKPVAKNLDSIMINLRSVGTLPK